MADDEEGQGSIFDAVEARQVAPKVPPKITLNARIEVDVKRRLDKYVRVKGVKMGPLLSDLIAEYLSSRGF
ncbi:hypothetical protein [Tsukamurella hominis]|uniref:hypothetical protein n=1 Tax=Tsukamurella hominis TaxID=1970232 RepID=UPI0039EA107D